MTSFLLLSQSNAPQTSLPKPVCPNMHVAPKQMLPSCLHGQNKCYRQNAHAIDSNHPSFNFSPKSVSSSVAIYHFIGWLQFWIAVISILVFQCESFQWILNPHIGKPTGYCRIIELPTVFLLPLVLLGSFIFVIFTGCVDKFLKRCCDTDKPTPEEKKALLDQGGKEAQGHAVLDIKTNGDETKDLADGKDTTTQRQS